MKKIANPLAIVSSFVLGTALAHAGTPAQDGVMQGQFEGKIIKEMDTNGDGEIARAEFDAFHANRFKEMDTNGDGKITPDEIKAERDKILKNGKDKRFDAADANHDGVLTRAETKKTPMLYRHFDEMDVNQDGKVTREEMDFTTENWRRKREKMKSPG